MESYKTNKKALRVQVMMNPKSARILNKQLYADVVRKLGGRSKTLKVWAYKKAFTHPKEVVKYARKIANLPQSFTNCK